MKLSRYEQETIITFNAEKDIASIYTLDPVWQRKLDRLAEKSPSFYECVRADGIGKAYTMPKRFLSFRTKEKTVTLTEEQKEKAKQRLRKAEK